MLHFKEIYWPEIEEKKYINVFLVTKKKTTVVFSFANSMNLFLKGGNRIGPPHVYSSQEHGSA